MTANNMTFPETVMPEFIREDVQDAVIDALAWKDIQLDYEYVGHSDRVDLPPLELKF